MKLNHVLIDCENVRAQPEIGAQLAADQFRLLLFMGANQPRLEVSLVMALQPLGPRVQYVTIAASGRNALDFHIAYYIGKLAATEPEAYFHVISCDKGYDPLLAHLKSQGIKAQRWTSVAEIPILKTTDSASSDDKLSSIIAYLVQRGAQRPASAKTLKGSIGALFHPKLEEAEIDSLVNELRRHGVLELVANKVAYNLPD